MDIERKIHFYLPMHSATEPWRGDFPAAEVMNRFDVLNEAGPDEVVLPLVNQRGMAAQSTLAQRGCHHGVLYLFREDDWPWVRDVATGEITPVDIPNGQLALPTYFAMGPQNVLALLYNHTGPRIGWLERYLAFSSDLEVVYAPIPNPQIIRTLREANEVRSVEMSVPTANVNLMPRGLVKEELDGLRTSYADTVELRWSIDARRHDDGARRGFTGWAKDVAMGAVQSPLLFNKLRVTVAPDDAPDSPALNLLEESIILSETVAIEGHSKWITPDEAARAIRAAFRRAGPILEEALGSP